VNADIHERARLLIALSGPDGLSKAEQNWLDDHLGSCSSCRKFVETSGEMVRALRAIPVATNWSLVATTQRRVRQRAQELQLHHERLRLVCVCCGAVAFGTASTTAVLWRGFAYIGQHARLSPSAWAVPFAVFCLMPGILAGILLLARGAHLGDHSD
jgi:predicted anti-sigma-YlaC factor YlaD